MSPIMLDEWRAALKLREARRYTVGRTCTTAELELEQVCGSAERAGAVMRRIESIMLTGTASGPKVAASRLSRVEQRAAVRVPSPVVRHVAGGPIPYRASRHELALCLTVPIAFWILALWRLK